MFFLKSLFDDRGVASDRRVSYEMRMDVAFAVELSEF